MRRCHRHAASANALAAALLAIALSACAADVEQKAPPLNPSPRDAYRLEVWVEDPPKPMRLESMQATFQETSSGCLPLKPGSGAPAVDPVVAHPLSFESVGKDRFAANVHADLLQQTDLYGRGECQWRLIGVEVLWTDGALRYRQFASVLPFNEEVFPIAEYAVFSRESRGTRGGDGLPTVALPIKAGKGNGAWPDGAFEDINLRRTTPATGATTIGPYRAVGPRTDFRVMSLSQRADNS